MRGGIAAHARQIAMDADDPLAGYVTANDPSAKIVVNGVTPEARTDSVKPGTVKRYRHLLRLAVNAVALDRGLPYSSIRSLRDVVNPDGVRSVVKVYIRRQKERGGWDKRSSSIYGIVAWMLGVARSWLRLDQETIAIIEAMLSSPSSKTESVGRMSARRRDLLKNLHHEWFVRTWIHLPTNLASECRNPDGSYKTDERSRAKMRAAVVLAIGQVLPLRLENLATFTISGRRPTLVRPRVRTGFWSADVPADEAKNENGAYGVLDDRASKIISDYVNHVREFDLAQYADGDSDCLFPGSSKSDHRSGHIDISCIGDAVSDAMRSYGLGDLTTHFIRHIVATLMLAWNPSIVRDVANLLGDTVETVEKHYVLGNTAAAVRMNLAMIEHHLRESGEAITKIGAKTTARAERKKKAEAKRAA